jgi:hypothetical protein
MDGTSAQTAGGADPMWQNYYISVLLGTEMNPSSFMMESLILRGEIRRRLGWREGRRALLYCALLLVTGHRDILFARRQISFVRLPIFYEKVSLKSKAIQKKETGGARGNPTIDKLRAASKGRRKYSQPFETGPRSLLFVYVGDKDKGGTA